MELPQIAAGDTWMLAEDIPDSGFQFLQIPFSAFVNEMERVVGINYRQVLAVHRGYDLVFYYGEKDSNDFAKHILKRLVDDLEFGPEMNRQIRRHAQLLREAMQAVDAEWLAAKSNAELVAWYLEIDAIHTDFYTWTWLPNAVDMFHGNLTNYLREVLARQLPEDEVSAALVELSSTSETSIIDQEHESLLRAILCKQAGDEVGYEQALAEHCQRYFYHKHLWVGREGVYDLAYYQAEVAAFIATGKSASEVLKERTQVQAVSAQKREALFAHLRLAKAERNLFETYAEFAVTKLYRRDAQLFWAYKMSFVMEEIARRLEISLMESRFLFPWEIEVGLLEGLTEGVRIELPKRAAFCVYYTTKGIDQIFTGSEAEAIAGTLKGDVHEELAELRGQVACLGRVTGVVRIVNSVADMAKLYQGEILVSIATNPDIVPAMKKAGAIITEQGGITSHAAIVSRELGVPCIIGTKIATKVLRDGDLVEVDANAAVVRILKRA